MALMVTNKARRPGVLVLSAATINNKKMKISNHRVKKDTCYDLNTDLASGLNNRTAEKIHTCEIECVYLSLFQISKKVKGRCDRAN